MAAKKGKDILLKVGTSDGTFVSAAGLRSTGITFNSTTVDITNANSSGNWRELLGGAGVKSASISGSGIFRDEVSDEQVRGFFFNSEIKQWQVVIPDFGTIQGDFQIASLEYSGSYDDVAVYEISLVSAGALSFTASS